MRRSLALHGHGLVVAGVVCGQLRAGDVEGLAAERARGTVARTAVSGRNAEQAARGRARAAVGLRTVYKERVSGRREVGLCRP